MTRYLTVLDVIGLQRAIMPRTGGGTGAPR